MRRLGLTTLGILACIGLLTGAALADEPLAEPPSGGEDAPKAAQPKTPNAQPAKPAAPPLMTLREAARKGLLDVVGRNPASYKQVQLHLTNQTDGDLRVDIAGSHLIPSKRGSCQRLGLGPVVTPRSKKGRRRRPKPTKRKPRIDDDPPGTVIVLLGPKQEKVVHVNTCCLDSGKPAPRKHVFRAAPEKLPPVREKVLRWWADHPETPQGSVNSAIWQFREMHETQPGKRPPPEPTFKSGVASLAGTTYLLRSGELMARDLDGIDRFLGTEIDAVHPTKGAVYAESYGGERNPRGHRIRELWRLLPTGERPWGLVAPIPEKLEIRNLYVAPSGDILVTTNLGLYRVDPKRERFDELLATGDTANLSLRFGKRGRLFVTQRLPSQKGYYQGGELKGEGMPVCQLLAFDLKKGTHEVVKSFWNVTQIQAGPAGVYALTGAGKLRRLIGRSFKNAPGQRAYERILRVGTKCVWLETKKGRMVAVGKHGNHRFEDGPASDPSLDWDLDERTDEVVIRRSRDFLRVEPIRGKRTEIPVR